MEKEGLRNPSCQHDLMLIIMVINRAISLMSRVFANGPGDPASIPSRVIPKTLKMVLDASLLNTHHYKVKWGNSGNGVAPSPTPRCGSYWKGSFWVILDKGHQLDLLLLCWWRSTNFKRLHRGGSDACDYMNYLLLILHFQQNGWYFKMVLQEMCIVRKWPECPTFLSHECFINQNGISWTACFYRSTLPSR